MRSVSIVMNKETLWSAIDALINTFIKLVQVLGFCLPKTLPIV